MTGGGGSKIAVILLDENGSIVDAHASCAETFGWQREELLGKDIKDLLQYGRDLLMSQLHLLEEDDSGGNTSFTVRVLAKRKDQQQFPARATIRRFQELQCWTVAFYRTDAETAESAVQPCVSAEEISLAKRALEDRNSGKRQPSKPRKVETEAKKGDNMSVSRLWRNSRLLFSSREDKAAESEALAALEAAQEKKIADDTDALVTQCVEAVTPREPQAQTAPVSSPLPAPEKSPEPKPAAPSGPLRSPLPEVPAVRSEPSVVTAHSSENVGAIARLKAELEKERGERARVEQRAASLSSQVQNLHLQLSEGLNLERENQSRVATLDQELRSLQEVVSRAAADLESERAERLSGDEQVKVLRELNLKLDENVTLLQKGRQALEASHTEFQTHFERNQASLKDAEVALDREREARQRLEQSLNGAIREHRVLEQKLSSEILRLQTALTDAEMARSQSEKQALRSRAETLQAASEARARAHRFRQNFSHVLEHINGTTRELLQSPLSEEQKCVIEALLEDVVSLEATLEKDAVCLGSEAQSIAAPALTELLPKF